MKRVIALLAVLVMFSTFMATSASAATKQDIIAEWNKTFASKYVQIGGDNKITSTYVIMGTNFINQYNPTSEQCDKIVALIKETAANISDKGPTAHSYTKEELQYVLSQISEACSLLGLQTGFRTKSGSEHDMDVVFYIYDPKLDAIVFEYDGDLVPSKTGPDYSYLYFAIGGVAVLALSLGAFLFSRKKIEG